MVGDIEWDTTRLEREFKTGLNPDSALEAIRKYFVAHHWETDEDASKVPNLERRVAKRRPPNYFQVIKRVTRGERLEPLTQDARNRMAAWALKDAYPRGVGRGGYLEVYYRYTFEATVRNDGSTSIVDTVFTEEIDPLGGGIPDKHDYMVKSYASDYDPFSDIEDALTNHLRD